MEYSGFCHAAVVLGGESYAALAEGLQDALWALGGVPKEHRTDSLSAAFRNLRREAREDLTARYEALPADYGMAGSRNNRGRAHENGSVEGPSRAPEARARGRAAAEGLSGLRDGRFVPGVRGRGGEPPQRARPGADRRGAGGAGPAAGAAQRRFRGDAGAGDEHGRLLAAAGVLHGALAACGTPAAGAAVRRPPGGVLVHGRTHDAAAGPGGPGRAAGAGRQLPACAAVAAPQADGAAELGPPRRPVPPRRVPPGLDALREGPDDRRACRRTVDLLALAHDRCCEAQLAAEIERGLDAGELPDAKVLRERFLPPPESLPAIGTEVPALSEYDDADREGRPSARLLAALASHEVTDRERRRFERHRAEAKLPPRQDARELRLHLGSYACRRRARTSWRAATSGSMKGRTCSSSGLPERARPIWPRASGSSWSKTGSACSTSVSQGTAIDRPDLRFARFPSVACLSEVEGQVPPSSPTRRFPMSRDKLRRIILGAIAGCAFALVPTLFTDRLDADSLGCDLLRCTPETCCWISSETDTICDCERIDDPDDEEGGPAWQPVEENVFPGRGAAVGSPCGLRRSAATRSCRSLTSGTRPRSPRWSSARASIWSSGATRCWRPSGHTSALLVGHPLLGSNRSSGFLYTCDRTRQKERIAEGLTASYVIRNVLVREM